MAPENQPSVVPLDAENPLKPPPEPPSARRRRLLRRAAYVIVGILILLTVILLPIGLSLYKVNNPKMTMKSVDLVWDNLPPGVFLRVNAAGSVKNTNKVTFYFKKSLTTVYWEGKRLTSAAGPGGATGAGKSYDLALSLDVGGDSEADLLELFRRLNGKSKVLNVNTSTVVDGHVKIFGIFNHKAQVFIDCRLSVDFGEERIMNQSCNEYVKV